MKNEIVIENLKISELKPYEKNARTHPKDQIDVLAKNIEAFGFTVPILINKENVILAGHGRLEAVKQLNWQDVPCTRLEGLSEKQEKAVRLSDNRIQEMSEWKMELALPELKELGDLGDLTGFDKDLLIEPEERDDEVPEIPKEPKSKLGDMYQLGKHRILCGDATKIEDVEKLMGGEKADMVFTDPPYSSGGFQESGKRLGSIGARGQKSILTDTLSTRGYKKLLSSMLELCDASVVFVFCDWKMWIENFDLVEKAGYVVRNMLVWDKQKMGMGMPFRNQHELVVFGSKIAGKIGNGKTPNVLKYDRELNDGHPNQKPVKLIVDCILQIEELTKIYDPFLGSGSTLIACEKTNRICYGMELDPKYIDVIIKRFEDYTNTKAIKL